MRCTTSKIVANVTMIAIAALASVTVARADTLRIGGTGVALGGMRLLGASFMKLHPDVEIEVLPSLGSTGGVKALLAGAIDVAVSSRALKENERSEGAEAYLYARTPLAVVTSPDTPIEAITLDELKAIYTGETTRWPDGTTIRLVLRPASETDTKLLRKLSPEMDQAVDVAFTRPGLIMATNDQENAEALERLPGAIGLTAIGQIETEERRLKVLSLDGVKPTGKPSADENYGFFKDLYVVSTPNPTTEASDFLAFVKSPDGQQILADTGHIPMAE